MLVSNNPEFKAVHNLLHKLWTKDVGKEGYVKADWLKLDEMILVMMRNAGVAGV